MRVIVHAGMHKTGSSSIQRYLHTHPQEDVVYARWEEANHSPLFVLLFQDEDALRGYYGFRDRPTEFLDALPAYRANWRSSLEEDMRRAEGKTLVISAEDISSPQYRVAIERFHTFLTDWTDDITVVGYARKPLAYAVSGFQQLLKGSYIADLKVEALWPNYQKRLGMLEDIFEQGRCVWRLYDRTTLEGGDVVKDFCNIIGIDAGKTDTVEANHSLSAEATALLFMHRSRGAVPAAGFPGAMPINARFVKNLSVVGSSRFTFSEALWQPVLEKHCEDMQWMEARLGVSLSEDGPSANVVPVSGPEDLIRLAVQSYPLLLEVLRSTIEHGSGAEVERTVRALDMLLASGYRGPR